jgi:hypothetical protein
MPRLAEIRTEGRALHLIQRLKTPHILDGWLRDWLCSRRGKYGGRAIVDALEINTGGEGWATTAAPVRRQLEGEGYLTQPYTNLLTSTYTNQPYSYSPSIVYGTTPSMAAPNVAMMSTSSGYQYIPLFHYNNFSVPPPCENECVLVLNRKADFWIPGTDPGREVHVVVSNNMISWAKPVPPAYMYSTGNPLGQWHTPLYGVLTPQYRKSIEEFAAAFPPESVDSIQILQASAHSTVSSITYHLHTDDATTTPMWHNPSNFFYDPTGTNRFAQIVIAAVLGQPGGYYTYPVKRIPLQAYKDYWIYLGGSYGGPEWTPQADPATRITDLVAPPFKPAKKAKPSVY